MKIAVGVGTIITIFLLIIVGLLTWLGFYLLSQNTGTTEERPALTKPLPKPNYTTDFCEQNPGKCKG